MNFTPYELINDLLSEGHSIVKMATGDSMLPTIPSGALLRITPIEQHDIRLGDILIYQSPRGNILIHRVSIIYYKNSHKFIQTWGDNNHFPDTAIPYKRVFGKVTAYRTNGGEWSNLSNSLLTYLKFFTRKYGVYYITRMLKKISS